MLITLLFKFAMILRHGLALFAWNIKAQPVSRETLLTHGRTTLVLRPDGEKVVGNKGFLEVVIYDRDSRISLRDRDED